MHKHKQTVFIFENSTFKFIGIVHTVFFFIAKAFESSVFKIQKVLYK